MKEPEIDNFGAVEKDIYVEPPDLPSNIPEKEKLTAWMEWQKEDDKKRRAHRLAFNRQLKKSSPDFKGVAVFKSGGVYKQKNAGIALDGNEGNLENILAIPAIQDRYFQTRGCRAGKSNRYRHERRKQRSIKKAQLILSKRKNNEK